MPPLRQLPKLDNINGDKSEKSKRLQDVKKPRKERDAATKEFVEKRGTFAASADAVSTGSITIKDEGGTDRKVMIKA